MEEENRLTHEALQEALKNCENRRQDKLVFVVPEQYLSYCKKMYPNYEFFPEYELKPQDQGAL